MSLEHAMQKGILFIKASLLEVREATRATVPGGGAGDHQSSSGAVDIASRFKVQLALHILKAANLPLVVQIRGSSWALLLSIQHVILDFCLIQSCQSWNFVAGAAAHDIQV